MEQHAEEVRNLEGVRSRDRQPRYEWLPHVEHVERAQNLTGGCRQLRLTTLTIGTYSVVGAKGTSGVASPSGGVVASTRKTSRCSMGPMQRMERETRTNERLLDAVSR